MYILVTYDVDTTDKSGQRRLRRVAKACLDYGQRVQNSVFECELTEAQFCILKEHIRDIIDTDADSVRFYHLNRKFLGCKLRIMLIKQLSYRCEYEVLQNPSAFRII